jgi:mRNA-degrading endonuclease RelE of RelBE toxin-antitoxin system
MIFEELSEFKKDLKNLLKSYRTLHEDLAVVKSVLKISLDERPLFSFQIDNLGIKSCIIKVKKIACKALKGKGVQSGLRLIYAYFPNEQKIIFIELYHKKDKQNEDRKRITQHFK